MAHRKPAESVTVTHPTPGRAYAGLDPEARQAHRRAQFIEAGLRLFGSIGYRATTMRLLCAEAGLTNRYFYESFESIEALLMACYEQLIGAHRQAFLEAIEQAPDDLPSKLEAGLKCFLTAMQNPTFARITQLEVIGVSPQVDALYTRAMRDFSEIATKLLERYGLGRDRSKRELQLIAFALTGGMVMTAGMWMRSGYRDPIETVMRATLTLLLGTVRELEEPQV